MSVSKFHSLTASTWSQSIGKKEVTPDLSNRWFLATSNRYISNSMGENINHPVPNFLDVLHHRKHANCTIFRIIRFGALVHTERARCGVVRVANLAFLKFAPTPRPLHMRMSVHRTTLLTTLYNVRGSIGQYQCPTTNFSISTILIWR